MKRFYKENVPCHLCGLPIPPEIVHPGHPLFGTQDHLVPKSKGGQSKQGLAPAHRYCNIIRGNKEITDVIRQACRACVLRIANSNRKKGGNLGWGNRIVKFAKREVRP